MELPLKNDDFQLKMADYFAIWRYGASTWCPASDEAACRYFAQKRQFSIENHRLRNNDRPESLPNHSLISSGAFNNEIVGVDSAAMCDYTPEGGAPPPASGGGTASTGELY